MKHLSVLAFLSLLVSTWSAPVYAQLATCFGVSRDGGAIVSFKNNYPCDLRSITVPSRIGEVDIRRISDEAFKDKWLRSVEISSGVVEIGRDAFYRNRLTSVQIPDSVIRIEEGAFRDNRLTSVKIPNSLTRIRRNVFQNNGLTSVEIPSSVTSIEQGAFSYNQLTSVEIPNSVTSIEKYAFEENQLIFVKIGSSVTSIEEYAFYSNPLIRISIGSDVSINRWQHGRFSSFRTFYIDQGRLAGNYIYNEQTSSWEFYRNFTNPECFYIKDQIIVDLDSSCRDLDELVIPDFINNSLITGIDGWAFDGSNISSVVLPYSVEHVGMGAFMMAPITKITVDNPNLVIDDNFLGHSAMGIYGNDFEDLFYSDQGSAGSYIYQDGMWIKK